MRVPEEASRDFVAGCLIVKNEKVLLLDHDKYGVWLAPGGHVEERETPDETAVRETLEETGYTVDLIQNSGVVEEEYIDVPDPFNVNLHRVEKGHWHCDFLFLAKLGKVENELADSPEHSGGRWFTKKELKSNNYDIPFYLRNAASDAIDQI